MQDSQIPLRSYAFAVITPLSADAITMFKMPSNNSFLDESATGYLFPRMRLELANLLGRSCISFGSSRHNNVQVPEAKDIDNQQFVIRFEMQTGLLLISDTSSGGTWISSESTQSHKLLKGATHPLLQETLVMFGRNRRFKFLLSTTNYRRDPELFTKLFATYAGSLGQQQVPSPVRQLCAACCPVIELAGQERYLRLHHLGQGGFGHVYTCLRISDGKLFAVKTLKGHFNGKSEVARESARKEAQLLRHINHPSIINFVDQSMLTGDLFIEFSPHGSLASLLDQMQPCTLHYSYSKPVARQCLRAIQYLNNIHDLIHNDVKPENILIQSLEPIRVKLCDFGGAQDIITIHATGQVLGTPQYQAPEFATSLHSFGVDVFALGVVILNMSGCWPYEPMVSDGMVTLPIFWHLPYADLLAGMLQPDSASRYRPSDCLNHPWVQTIHVRKRQYPFEDERQSKGLFKKRKTFHVGDLGHLLHYRHSRSTRSLSRIRGALKTPRMVSRFFSGLKRNVFP